MTRLRYTSMAQCLAVSRSPADNCEGPLLYCLPGVNQPVISTANGFSALRYNPLRLHVSTPQPFNTTIIPLRHVLDRLRLGPRRHPKEQHLSQ